MCKWKIKFRKPNIDYNVPPVFVPSGKADFSDGKILGGKCNPDCYRVDGEKIVFSGCGKIIGDAQAMLALMNNEVIYLVGQK